MKKIVLFLTLILFGVTINQSCKKFDYDIGQEVGERDKTLLKNDKFGNKDLVEFSLALMEVMKKNKDIMELIKKESLKKIDGDYDVLIYSIIDKKNIKGITFKELINKNLITKDNDIHKILNRYPTLTIFVPTLPYDSFSAEKWDCSKEIPAITIRNTKSNRMQMISPDNKIGIIPSDAIPGFPVIVLKINERIVSNKNFSNFSNLKTKEILEKDGIKFKFWSEVFGNLKNNGTQKRVTPMLDQKIIDAYNIYQQQYQNLNGWQRDYIYYNIQPTTPNGPFIYDFKEYVTNFNLEGNATSAYNLISDQTDDPHYLNNNRIGTGHWTDGDYEFKFSTLINAKNGVGDELINGLVINPNDLFKLEYEVYSTGWWFWKKRWYRITGIHKRNDYWAHIPLINWNLDDYATSIKIHIEEVDLTTTTTITDTRTVKFATNFGISPSLGEKIKLGLKFGASLEDTQTHTIQRSFTQGNDDLGSVIINFADKIIIQKFYMQGQLWYSTRSYSTGYCKFGVEPMRVQ